MIVSIWRNRLSADKKSTSSFTFSLRYCKDTVNLFFWVIWACLATHTQSDNKYLWKTFVLIWRQKINFIPHAFLEILQRYCNFSFWILWVCLITHTQNESINFDVYPYAINKRHHSLLSWDNNISFYFRLFPRNTNDKIFQKIKPKNLFWGHFGLFLHKFDQKWIFLAKRTLSVFKCSNYLPSCQKSEKTNEQFLRKTPNRQRERQTNGYFIRPTVGRESDRGINVSLLKDTKKEH